MDILKHLLHFLLFPIYIITWLIPKKNKQWSFGSCDGSLISDNSFYFFKYISDNKKHINARFFTKNKAEYEKYRNTKYNVCYLYDIPSIIFVMRSEQVFISHGLRDLSPYLLGGVTVNQLWHGIPLKKICADIDCLATGLKQKMIVKVKSLIYKVFPYFEATYCHRLLIPSDYYVHCYDTAFKCKPSYIFSGQPRLDAFKFSERNVKNVKVISWLPTHRKYKGVHDQKVIKSFLTERQYLKELDKVLSSQNYELWVKRHPLDRNFDFNLDGFSSIKLKEDLDTYELLVGTDVLITDYSSVFYDYLELNKPIIFYCPDILDYDKHVAGFNFDFVNHVPGVIIKDKSDIIGLIASGVESIDMEQNKRDVLINKVKSNNTTYCSELYNELVKND